MKLQRAAFATALPSLLILSTHPAFAGTFGGGGGGNWAFVAPVNGLAGAIVAITGALIVIALACVIGWHLVHHHGGELGSLVGKVLIMVIGGAVLVTAANFMANAGVQAAVIPR